VTVWVGGGGGDGGGGDVPPVGVGVPFEDGGVGVLSVAILVVEGPLLVLVSGGI
jgi:hypothetical protein